MANGKKKLNNRKNVAYSSYYTIVSFLISLAYLVVDIYIDDLAAALLALGFLVVSIFACEIGIAKIRKGLEENSPNARKLKEKLANAAERIGYLSYLLLAASLIWAAIANLQHYLANR